MPSSCEPFAFEALLGLPDAPAPLHPREVERRAALAKAREEGRAEALSECRAERDTALLAAATALVAKLGDLGEALERMADEQERAAAELALEAAGHLAARALERDPEAAVGEAIGRALEQARRGSAIRVRVHPDLVAGIEALVAERQAGERRRLQLYALADPALAVGDARIEWDTGTLCLDREARRAALEKEFSAILAPVGAAG